MTDRKTTPPPFLAANATLPTDEVAQTYARDAARQALEQAGGDYWDAVGAITEMYPIGRPGAVPPAPVQRDEVELEVDAMFPDPDVCAEAIVVESEAHARMTAAYRGESLGRRGGK